MLPEVSEIKPRRLKLGLNQSQLAFASGISQSLVAKLEAGKIDASYSKTKRIFEALEQMENKTQLKAKSVMRTRIVSVRPTDSVRKAIDEMRSHGFSQLPVLEKSNCVGSISEKTVLEKMTGGWNAEKLSSERVEKIMDEAFPVVGEETPASAVSVLLQNAFAVLVRKGKRMEGIITKADLLRELR